MSYYEEIASGGCYLSGFSEVEPWIITITTTIENETFSIYCGGQNFKINWGDSNETLTGSSQGWFSHTYSSIGNYYVGVTRTTSGNSYGYIRLVNGYTGKTSLVTAITPIPSSLELNVFEQMFEYCQNLTTIPRGLFKHCTNFTNSQSGISYRNVFAHCTSLSNIPSELFNASNDISNLQLAFYNTALTSIPNNLGLNTITRNLSDGATSNLFGLTDITSIPNDLFNDKFTGFSGTFANCYNLTEVPSDLFASCTSATSFASVFFGCGSLSSIPTGLFDNNTQATNFDYCFSNCGSISLPPDLFRYNTLAQSFNNTFGSSGYETILTVADYDRLLQELDTYNSNTFVTLGAGNNRSSPASSLYRYNLMNLKGWTINDGGEMETYETTSAGGAKIDGASNSGIDLVTIASGGSRASGSSNVYLTNEISVLGGCNLGGSFYLNLTNEEIASGGCNLGGSFYLTNEEITSGGCNLNGQAILSFYYQISTIGGSTIGGYATVSTKEIIAEGGAEIGLRSISNAYYHLINTSGCNLGGSFYLTNEEITSGGCNLNGQAILSFYDQISTIGGSTTGGSATVYTNEITPEGGAEIGGSIQRIKENGIYSFGYNVDGQLGNNESGDLLYEYLPIKLNISLRKISGGFKHFIGIGNNKELLGWGINEYGQLGTGDTTSYSTPTTIGTATNWEITSGGFVHSLAINENGELYSWGNNISGNLGYENLGLSSNSVQRPDVLAPEKVGDTVTFKVTVGSGTNSFGSGNKFYINGRVCDGMSPLYLKTGVTYRFDQCEVSNFTHPLAFSTIENGTHAGGVKYNGSEITQNGTAGTEGGYLTITPTSSTPSSLYLYCENHSGMSEGETNIETNNNALWTQAAAGRHSIALNSEGELYTWGENEFGQLGDGYSGGTTSRSAPIRIGRSDTWTTIAAGYDHTLAINSSGELFACGRNDYGQLGDGTTTDRNTLTQIGTANNWVRIDAGYEFSVAINSNGEIFSWGRNQSGYVQLGQGITTNSTVNSPTQIGVGQDWDKVACGWLHTIASKTNKTVFGWGYNGYGALGNGTNQSSPYPTEVTWNNNVNDMTTTGQGSTFLLLISIVDETSSGGASLSGNFISSSSVDFSGVKANGNAIKQLEHTFETSGGSTLNGNSIDRKIYYNDTSGSVDISGSSIVGLSLTTSGGANIGGLGDDNFIDVIQIEPTGSVIGGVSSIVVTYNEESKNGTITNGNSTITIQPKTGEGSIKANGLSNYVFVFIPEMGLGSILCNGENLNQAIYNLEKYKRGQGRLNGKPRIEYLRYYVKSIMQNNGIAMNTPNILNNPTEGENKIIAPYIEYPEIDAEKSYRTSELPEWCKFTDDSCEGPYVSDVIEDRQGKYMPPKKRKDIVQPGVQLTTLTQQ